MATPTWLTSTQRIIGESHPQFADTVNSVIQSMYATFLAEHQSTGKHDVRTTGLVGEIGTFVGSGAERTISLSNSNLTPKKIYVWEGKRTGEFVTNGGFEVDTSGWTFTGDGSATGGTAGGQSGNCVAIANNGTAFDYIQQTVNGLVVGRSYSFSVYEKSGTITGSAFYQLAGAVAYGPVNFTSDAAWTQKSYSFTATQTYLTIDLANNENVLNGTILFDTCSLVENEGQDATRIDLMTSDKAQPFRYQTDAWEADLIDNEQTGSFDVGDEPINTSGETNYYIVLGYDNTTVPTGDTGAGSDPTWITSSTANKMIADGTATVSSGNIGNNTQSEIWTEFIEEHTVAGVHSVTIAHERIDTVSWAGDDSDDRTISCNISDLDIMYIEVWKDGAVCVFKSTDMAGDTTKIETSAAFAANYVQDITTNGEFEVGTGLNASGSTYVAFIIGV